MERMELAFDMSRFVGKTVTIFTASGGLSGSGFTGVLACVDNRVVKLITCIGAPPCCPVGSACGGPGPGGCGSGIWGGWGRGGNSWGWGNMLGSVTEIPLAAIVSFTHNAI